MTRYFMTINEAAFLVLLAGSFAERGEVFVLDMGEPVRIADLARQMISLSGLTEKTPDNPNGDIEIRIAGMRSGEKLYEELLVNEESLPTPHPKILRAPEVQPSKLSVEGLVLELTRAAQKRDETTVMNILEECVEHFSTPG